MHGKSAFSDTVNWIIFFFLIPQCFLCQRGLIQNLRCRWFWFLCGDDPRWSSAIHREEDESAYSVSSATPTKKTSTCFLRFYVCIFIYAYIKRCNPNMVAVCVSVSQSSSPKTQRRLKRTYAWCWRSVQSFFSSRESLDHLCCLPVTLSALLVQCWTLE